MCDTGALAVPAEPALGPPPGLPVWAVEVLAAVRLLMVWAIGGLAAVYVR